MFLQIDTDVPLTDRDPDLRDLAVRAMACCKTLQEAEEAGVVFPDPGDEDKTTATALVTAYAGDPEGASRTATPERFGALHPAAVKLTATILKEFGTTVVAQAHEIRNLVINKLILETENTDGKLRIKALELLGKMTDVSLFTERKEITHVQRTTDEVAQELRARIERLRNAVTLEQTETGEYAAPESIDTVLESAEEAFDD